MESKTLLDVLQDGLMNQILMAIEDAGISASQAAEIPGYLAEVIKAKNQNLLDCSRFKA